MAGLRSRSSVEIRVAKRGVLKAGAGRGGDDSPLGAPRAVEE